MTRTPADVPEALFRQLHEALGEKCVVELVAAIAAENFRARFNRPFDVQPMGLSEGAFCPVPERAPVS
jgi:alkylhydroperoxidase family enzyme